MDSEQELMELMQTAEGMAKLQAEELLDDLKGWVEESELLGKCLKHPLIYDVPMFLPGAANMRYLAKKKALEQAIEHNDYRHVVWLHERPYRCWALVEYVVGVDGNTGDPLPLMYLPPEIRDLAADVWTDSENIHQHLDDWGHLFGDWEAGDPMLFNEDPEGWAELDDPLVVYRAGIDDGGWSWTLDPKIAEFFAKRFGENHVMTMGKVRKESVFGYLTGRSESEVLCLDGSVFDQKPYVAITKKKENA